MGFTSWHPLWRIFLITFAIVLYLSNHLTGLNGLIKLVGFFFALPHISWQISKVIRNWCQLTFVSPINKAVLITGCDSGFGQMAAKALDTYGFHVFAGCLQPKGLGAQKLYKTTSNRLRILSLDITREDDIDAAIKEIEESDLTLWAVINNAGIVDYGAIEWDNNANRIRKVMDVNLFGAIRVISACLPLIRRSKGRIVNVSSVFGRFTLKGLTPYCMSKHALKSYTDGLRRELTDFGVKVVCIEPLCYKTDMTKEERMEEDLNACWKTTSDEVKSFYSEQYKTELQESLASHFKLARSELKEVSEAIEEAVTASSPLEFYRCTGPVDGLIVWLCEQFNDQCLDLIMRASNLKMLVKAVNFFSPKQKVI
ncbi:retinol dehydrogenase 7 [Tetranychus urticae]|uniref:Uncharacterized protein n=1 Tax=Tetranychus urticae TaxID=32264 RepID=T1KSS1_TETUR|nr:retinol dehydrogenase 7 [Tetranychus urticae]XP_015790275.1 retinol dehydrogenase 7 [Tetranychus urticae]XP_025017630.1 retinol dehydrogenase 7 [Tetranychus urticae]